MKLLNNSVICLYGLLWLGGVANYLFMDEPSPAASWAGPLFLLCAFLLALVPSEQRLRSWLLLAALGGFLAELIGLHSGLVFGNYHYGSALGPKLFGVPVAIAFAWGVLLSFAASLATRSSVFVGAISGAAWMVAADLLIDPLASGPLAYWAWPDGGVYFGVPLHNFLGWFIVSFLALLCLPRGITVPRQALITAVSIIMFYGLLSLPHVDYRPLAILAMALCIFMLWNFRSSDAVNLRLDRN